MNVPRYRALAQRRIEWPPKPFTKPLVRFAEAPLPAPVYEALRQIAFDERAKIHDLVMQGIEAVLRKRGYPSVDDLNQMMRQRGTKQKDRE